MENEKIGKKKDDQVLFKENIYNSTMEKKFHFLSFSSTSMIIATH